MQSFDVVGVGLCTLDYLGIVDRYPLIDEKTVTSNFVIQGGGITATAMVTVARLGGRASYIGKVGDDDFGKVIVAGLEQEGVSTQDMVVKPGDISPFSYIIVEKQSGKRTVIHTSGQFQLEAADVDRELIQSAGVVQVDAHHPGAALQAAIWANEAGVPVVMDAGSLQRGSIEIADRSDYLIVSQRFVRQLTGQDEPRQFIESNAGRRALTAVTLGDRGCLFVTGEDVFHQPAFTVDVVDTTGAGDVFHGAFSFGLAQGWPQRKIIEFASAVAALKCTKLGGRTGIPSCNQVIQFLAAQSAS
jgi:sulfofructose kinase